MYSANRRLGYSSCSSLAANMDFPVNIGMIGFNFQILMSALWGSNINNICPICMRPVVAQTTEEWRKRRKWVLMSHMIHHRNKRKNVLCFSLILIYLLLDP